MIVELSIKADADIENIYVYSFQNFGQSKADAYYLKIKERLSDIKDNPKIGRNTDFIKKSTRKLSVEKHDIYYKILGNRIFIIRILHQNMYARFHLK